MFTGIITAMGSVTDVEADESRLKLTIQAPYEDLALGESIAVNGACLTIMEVVPGTFSVQAVATTRGRTTIADLRVGSTVNLERAVAVGERMGGHFVQGHVDGVGEITKRSSQADALLLDCRVPPEVYAVTTLHGSIALDGVSLTVNALLGDGVVQVAVIPFTLAQTTLGGSQAGDRVQVEADMLAKVVQRLRPGGHESVPGAS